jgi:hypothetical protein
METPQSFLAADDRQSRSQAPTMEGAAHEPQRKVGANQIHPHSHGGLHLHLRGPPTMGDQGPREDYESVPMDRLRHCVGWQVFDGLEEGPATPSLGRARDPRSQALRQRVAFAMVGAPWKELDLGARLASRPLR